MNKSFGKLKQEELREHWTDEAGEFTPWLAEEENLALLGDAIQMDLEFVGTEQSIGNQSNFKVDILAKEVDSNQYVVIENQLEKTDHKHLGQLLTYAAGRSAKAVVWVAETICEEHRKALDWLNEKTVKGVGFFGLEIELWKIGDSKAAPKFNLVSQPNDWVKRITQSESRSELTETKILQQLFWTGLAEYMKTHKTSLNLHKPLPQHWYNLAVGRSGFWIALTVNSRINQIGCQLFIRETQSGFMDLREDKKEIEEELGANLKWQELPHRKCSRIVQYTSGNFQNREEWPELFEWLKERAEAFHKTFYKRIQNLDLDEEEAA